MEKGELFLLLTIHQPRLQGQLYLELFKMDMQSVTQRCFTHEDLLIIDLRLPARLFLLQQLYSHNC
jgi:hypothetical protein